MPDGTEERKELEESIAEGYEERDLSVRGILLFGIVFVLALGLVLVLATGVQWLFVGHAPPVQSPPQGLANAPSAPTFPAPALEAVPGAAYEQFLAQEQKLLNSYGWVDQKAGIVHIPIDRAMDLLLQKGLPTRPTTGTQFQDQGQTSPSGASSGRQPEQYP